MTVSLQHGSAAEKVESEKEISKPLDWPSNPIKPCRVDFVHSSFIDMPPFFQWRSADSTFFRRRIFGCCIFPSSHFLSLFSRRRFTFIHLPSYEFHRFAIGRVTHPSCLFPIFFFFFFKQVEIFLYFSLYFTSMTHLCKILCIRIKNFRFISFVVGGFYSWRDHSDQ